MSTPIKKLRLMGVRKFREEFTKLEEPVRVIKAVSRDGSDPEIIGVWTPEKRAAKP